MDIWSFTFEHPREVVQHPGAGVGTEKPWPGPEKQKKLWDRVYPGFYFDYFLSL